jgi:glycosyltransferase involved in cell wall biosynthesis
MFDITDLSPTCFKQQSQHCTTCSVLAYAGTYTINIVISDTAVPILWKTTCILDQPRHLFSGFNTFEFVVKERTFAEFTILLQSTNIFRIESMSVTTNNIISEYTNITIPVNLPPPVKKNSLFSSKFKKSIPKPVQRTQHYPTQPNLYKPVANQPQDQSVNSQQDQSANIQKILMDNHAANILNALQNNTTPHMLSNDHAIEIINASQNNSAQIPNNAKPIIKSQQIKYPVIKPYRAVSTGPDTVINIIETADNDPKPIEPLVTEVNAPESYIEQFMMMNTSQNIEPDKSPKINSLRYVKSLQNNELLSESPETITTDPDIQEYADFMELMKASGNNSKMKILIVIDKYGWCFDNISQQIMKYYSQEYEIITETINDDCTKYSPDYFDIVIKLWYGHCKTDPYEYFLSARKILCLFDYVHWVPQNSTNNESFIKNLENCHAIGYACQSIATILREYYPRYIRNREMVLIRDGVDTNIFKPTNIPNKKLKVGWVGNPKIPCKRFYELETIINKFDWVDFKTVTPKNYRQHDDMPEFYRTIDVIICFSTAEGTPNMILEAAACGVPWISTLVGVIEELQYTSSGIIIENIEDIEPALRELYMNPYKITQMGNLCRSVILEKYQWSSRVLSYGTLLKNPLIFPESNDDTEIDSEIISINSPIKEMVTENMVMIPEKVIEPVDLLVDMVIDDIDITEPISPEILSLSSDHFNNQPINQYNDDITEPISPEILSLSSDHFNNQPINQYNDDITEPISPEILSSDHFNNKPINRYNDDITEPISPEILSSDHFINKPINRYNDDITEPICSEILSLSCDHLIDEAVIELNTTSINENTNKMEPEMNVIETDEYYLVTSTQYPRYGGAATCAYNFHKYLLSLGKKSACIFFDNTAAKNGDATNPNNLEHVYSARMPPKNKKDWRLFYKNTISIIENIFDTTTMNVYAFNYLAPVISGIIFPKSSVYYMLTGCSLLSNSNPISAKQILEMEPNYYKRNHDEEIAIRDSDYIISNTHLMRSLFEHCYHKNVNGIYDLHEIYEIDAKPSPLKIYDIAFISSDFKRAVKNPNLIKDIYSSPRLSNYRKLSVGNNSDIMAECSDCVGFSTEDEIMKLLGNCRILLVPSLVESYSIVAVEATQNGCIVLSNRNTACSETIDKFYVLPDYDVNKWVDKIIEILGNYDYFQKAFRNDYKSTNPTQQLLIKPIPIKANILFCTTDAPFIGGAGTNTHWMSTLLGKVPGIKTHAIYFGKLYDNTEYQTYIGYGKNIVGDLVTIMKRLEISYGTFDYIFVKNYKIMCYAISAFPNIKIIFSPSGLRRISALASDNFLNDIQIDKIKTPLPYKPANNFNEFARINDINLDNYAIEKSCIIVPNSSTTHRIINKLYPRMPQLKNPIYLTNISYITPYIDDFSKREYDLIFASYSWKRGCKNYKMVSQLLSSPRVRNLNILIVGNDQTCKYLPNITSLGYVENSVLLQYMRSTKVLVAMSMFESNPNVIVEAASSGCNIVTSSNVGGYENLDYNSIVTDYRNLDSWIDTIEKNLVDRYPYNGPSRKDIIHDLIQLVTHPSHNREAVAFYKIPPLIDVQYQENTADTPVKFIAGRDDQLVEDIVEYDIYYQLFVKMAEKENCDTAHYVIYDDTVQYNTYYNVSQVYPTVNKYTTIWRIKDKESLSHFANKDFYFLRGTYYNFFSKIVPSNAKSVLVPATAYRQSLKPMVYNLLTPQVFDILLCHESEHYADSYNTKKLVRFNKFSSDSFVCSNNSIRQYDGCFVATHKQPTKNHHLFLDLLRYLDTLGKPFWFIYVGDIQQVLKYHNLPEETIIYTNIVLETIDSCSRQQLCNIYNNTRTNLLFSGRDSVPRVITETAACGCFNIALDTISDGKEYFDGVLGALVGDPDAKIVLRAHSSLAYLPSDLLWTKIADLLALDYNPSEISLYSKRHYNLANTLQDIYSD